MIKRIRSGAWRSIESRRSRGTVNFGGKPKGTVGRVTTRYTVPVDYGQCYRSNVTHRGSNRPFHFVSLHGRAQSLPPTLFIKCTFNFFAGTIIHHPRGVIRLGLRRGRARFSRRGRITNREIHRKMEPRALSRPPLSRVTTHHPIPLVRRNCC